MTDGISKNISIELSIKSIPIEGGGEYDIVVSKSMPISEDKGTALKYFADGCHVLIDIRSGGLSLHRFKVKMSEIVEVLELLRFMDGSGCR